MALYRLENIVSFDAINHLQGFIIDTFSIKFKNFKCPQTITASYNFAQEMAKTYWKYRWIKYCECVHCALCLTQPVIMWHLHWNRALEKSRKAFIVGDFLPINSIFCVWSLLIIHLIAKYYLNVYCHRLGAYSMLLFYKLRHCCRTFIHWNRVFTCICTCILLFGVGFHFRH